MSLIAETNAPATDKKPSRRRNKRRSQRRRPSYLDRDPTRTGASAQRTVPAQAFEKLQVDLKSAIIALQDSLSVVEDGKGEESVVYVLR